MKNTAIQNFIIKNRNLFWWIKEDEKKNISPSFLVETILSYGDIKSIKTLFKLLGIKKVAAIFYKQKSQKRVNYRPRTMNYFDLYFRKNA